MRIHWRTVVAASCFCLPAVPAAAQWAQCAADLDELRAVTRQVHEFTDRVASIEGALRNWEEAYSRCVEDRRNFRADPRTNPIPDSIRAGDCSQEILSLQSTEQRYGAEMTRAREAFANLAFAVQTVDDAVDMLMPQTTASTFPTPSY